jgi:hypothetical protein
VNLDERAIQVLRDASADLRPQPDPYRRVVARYRRTRLWWRATVGLVLAAVVAGGAALVPTFGDSPRPAPDDPFTRYNAWNARLVESPTRGAVGADPAFVADFARRVFEHQTAGDYRGDPRSVREVRVLFLDDVGSRRLAHVAYVLTGPDHNKWPYASISFVAARGASAEQLADPAATTGTGDGLAPFEVMPTDGGGAAMVAVAPAGCQIATRPLWEPDNWRPEPTGSYIVRTVDDRQPEWWRVTCDGVVEQSGPPPLGQPRAPIPDAVWNAAVAGARAVEDPTARARAMFSSVAVNWPAITPPALVWGGPVAGTFTNATAPFTGYGIVYATRELNGAGWVGVASVNSDQAGPDGRLSEEARFLAKVDPADPATTLVVPFPEIGGVLVIPPAGTATVRMLRDGVEVSRAQVHGGSVVPMPTVPAGLVVEALDATGTVVGRGEPTARGVGADAATATDEVQRWDR